MHHNIQRIKFKGVEFELNVRKSIFNSPYSNIMTMSVSADMEDRLIAQQNILQKSFIIIDLMKHICSKGE